MAHLAANIGDPAFKNIKVGEPELLITARQKRFHSCIRAVFYFWKIPRRWTSRGCCRFNVTSITIAGDEAKNQLVIFTEDLET